MGESIPWRPPEEYDLKVTVERKSGTKNFLLGIVVGGRQTAIGVDEEGLTGLSRIDGRKAEENETTYKGKLLIQDKESVLVCSIRKTGVALTVDGQKIFDWKGEANRLSRNPAVPLRRSDDMYISAKQSTYIVKQMILVPLSGEGKEHR